MVSENPTKTTVLPGMTGQDRGFVVEERVAAVEPAYGRVAMYHPPFWGAVIAGTLFAFSVFMLSWYLMLGCHVGITEGGVLMLGVGAAIWMWVTACVAYFCGGMMANMMSSSHYAAWLKGAAMWGLSIPLAAVIYGMSVHGGGLFMAFSLPHAGMYVAGSTLEEGAHFGFFWATFIGMACALVFSMIGSAAGCACHSDSMVSSKK